MRSHNQLVTVLLGTLTLLVGGCWQAGAGSLSFTIPTGWESFDQNAAGRHLYLVRTRLDRKVEDRALLAFHSTLLPPKLKDIPAYVRDLAELQVKYASTNLASKEYHMQKLLGPQCEGSYVTFECTNSLGGKFTSAFFALSVGGEVWNGQFTGPLGAWKQALAVLQTARKSE